MNKKTNLFIIYVTTLILSLLVLVIVKIVCKVEDIKLVDNFTNIYLSIVLLLSIVSILIWLLLNKKNIKYVKKQKNFKNNPRKAVTSWQWLDKKLDC